MWGRRQKKKLAGKEDKEGDGEGEEKERWKNFSPVASSISRALAGFCPVTASKSRRLPPELWLRNPGTQMSPQPCSPERTQKTGRPCCVEAVGGGSSPAGRGQCTAVAVGSALSCLLAAWLHGWACPGLNSAEVLLLSDRYSNEQMFYFKIFCLKK